MATRSTISVLHQNGKVSEIYCHWDGYLSNNGKILLENYSSQELAEELVSHGDLSVLRKSINPTSDMHAFDTPEKDVCVYYGRDRGEIGTAVRIYPNIQMWSNHKRNEEFNYMFVDGGWYVINDDGFQIEINLIRLTEEICKHGDESNDWQETDIAAMKPDKQFLHNSESVKCIDSRRFCQ